VDVGADILAVRVEPAVAGVDPHPDADDGVVRPGLGREGLLRVDHGGDGVSGPREDEEEPVAFALVLDATPRGDSRPDELAMTLEDGLPPIGAERLGEGC
jgi:hypothetical protein